MMKKITQEYAKTIYRPVKPDAHKGTQGHALLIGGSYGKMGSICLSAKAAMHSGAGLVTAFIPECGYHILQASIPEVMVITDPETRHLSKIETGISPDAIGIGPGIGKEAIAQQALQQFLQSASSPLVIDADALNILALNPKWMGLVPENSVFTPHPKEFERLLGEKINDADRLDAAMDFAKKYRINLVLKGATTYITDGNPCFENTTGNAALATAGSGDVLTGILTGLIAQGYEPLDAAKLGVFLHGRTADLALPQTGSESFVASDIIAFLGKAFLSLQ